MPPPAEVNDSSATTSDQQGELEGDQWTRVTRSKTGQQKKTDGNETDSSTSSKRSYKQAKKMRCDDDDNTINLLP